MKVRKLSAAVAVLASGALVLSACAPGDDTENGNGNGGTNGDADPGIAEGQVFTVEPEDGGLADLGADFETANDEIRVSLGPQPFNSYNGQTPSNYNVYNSTIVDRLFSGFSYVGTDLEIYQNEEFGSYEVINEDPFTVEYTINDEVQWSDGTPVTVADYVLDWAHQRYLGEGQFDGLSPNLGTYVPDGPQAESYDSKTFTVEYPDGPYADWELMIGAAHPSHVVAEETGISQEELVTAILEGDEDLIEDIAETWNTIWDTDPGTLPDAELIPSSGPYILSDWQDGEYVTLEANEDYWGTPPGVSTLIFQFVDNAAHVQALQNGDLHAIVPTETVDTRNELENLVEQGEHAMHIGDKATWEHLDIQYGEGSPFAETPELAEAFALCVPRDQILENLIHPVNPDAELLNAREVLNFQPDYDEIVAETYDGRYDTADVEAAAEIIQEHDAEGTEILIGHNAQERRHDTVELIQASCNEAGFEIVDGGDVDIDIAAGEWDVALFAWSGSGQIASGLNIYGWDRENDEPRPQNWNNYNNDVVSDAFEAIATSDDEDEIQEQIITLEQGLWEDLHGIPLYVHPGITAWDSSIANVRPTPAQSQLVWNIEQWQRVSE
ncbi:MULTISPECIES: ABC transporter substrate-binding protein [Auritidibacter]|uniref:ABC transporter substrate-binding protein n=1 Tax=Auritidibacter TaxID=1160973 RepID=UPI000D73D54B|nr:MULTISPECIES: ABC transporter substrate-binding protein [Auritidibacter]PXA80606.1 ABC transporter substrate-binding protein [Auritidibacter sp. NML120636]WGH85694.1 ABC transporter substrate-binding protein [Auritidibacter ignavus]WGH87982.1 ABC transporter substrate-binding protein [Auritidibacter ignavus]